MSLTRRAFLQRTAATLIGLELSEAGFSLLARRYQQALAQPARRKLALLIGINQYPESVADRPPIRGTVLSGCLTDVELQRELLLHRFGFGSSEVLTLTDQQATRTAIVEALSELATQAQPDDVVVVHFSGLGSRVKLDAAGAEICNTLVPIDATLPTEENPDCNDLFDDTLNLLLHQIPSDRVTAVLDLGYSNLGVTMQGNLRLRARPNAPVGQISAAELALQAQLRADGSSLHSRAPIYLSAAAIGQPAAEVQWSGFSAGLFTYALTQQLWQATPPTRLMVTFNQAATIVERFSNQQPQLSAAPAQPSAYETAMDAADGVVLSSSADGKFQVWLGGLPANLVENYAAGSLLEVAGKPAIVRSRDGLVATAYWIDAETPPPAIGQSVQEAVRILRQDASLTVAIDSSLERIERVDAASAFAALSHVSAVAAGEQAADYLFGKLQAPTLTASLQVPQTNEAGLKGYGLFLPSRLAIASTLIEGEEAVKTAVSRLSPQLQTLLAFKLLRLSENHAASRLGVQASLVLVEPQPQVVMQQTTQRALNSPPVARAAPPILSIDSRVEYQIYNYSDRRIYAILIGLNSSGNAIAYYPLAADEADGIAPGATLTLPQAEFAADWALHNSPGWMETYFICSPAPFAQTAAYLAIGNSTTRIIPLVKPLDVVQAVLRDLHQASATDTTSVTALDMNQWATLSFAYQRVDRDLA